MMKLLARYHWLVLVTALLTSSLALFAYKVKVLGYPVQPDTTVETWTVQARVDLTASGSRGALVTLELPQSPPGFSLMDEHFVSRGFGLSVESDRLNRSVTWAQRRPQGRMSLYYRGTVFRDNAQPGDTAVPSFPEPPELEEPFATALESLVSETREQSADIASFASAILQRINDPSPGEAAELFLSDVDSRLERAKLASSLLAGARIPSRIVHTIALSDDRSLVSPMPWLKVHNGSRWLFFDPDSSQRGLPEDQLVWWRGDRVPVTSEGVREVDWQFSVTRNAVNPIDLARYRSEQYGSRLNDFSLLSLPVDVQAVYSVLLLIPIGALMIALLRNVVGIKTFGTFMPVLIAMAFRETELVAGVVLFVLITAVGLLFRFYLERLRLLLVPRLTAVLIAVLVLLLLTSMVSHQLGIQVGLSVSLFPMVILAMVIERMSIAWEERGPSDAVQQAIGSLVVAAMAYLLMGWSLLEHLFFIFPELTLVVLAASIALGRYTGFRLSELLRFRELAGGR
jgi:hypothetical protein